MYLENGPDVVVDDNVLLWNGELLDFAESGTEGSIFLLDTLGVLAVHGISWSWAALDLDGARGRVVTVGNSEGDWSIAVVNSILSEGPGWALA